MKIFTGENHPIQMFWLSELRKNLNSIESDKLSDEIKKLTTIN